MTEASTRLGAGRYVDPQLTPSMPEDIAISVHELATVDEARVTGVLRRPRAAGTVVTIMHPRQDVTHHPLIPHLLAAGYAVWTQGSRSPNNDLDLIHERALLDFTAGQVFLREVGFAKVVSLGHSGGGTLASFYCQQAALPPAERLATAPSGRPVALREATMPPPDGLVFLAPHPGQGALLERVIDPSVSDELDPMSVDPELDPYAPHNGFREPPSSSSYDDAFVERYRSGQKARVRRIDEFARQLVDEAGIANRSFKTGGDARDRRRALAPRLITVYRTDADLRNVDLSLDSNERPYGSLFGRRPDLTNFGLVGFGRISTAEAWMSTWSANTTNADFVRCAPAVTAPTLLLEFTGDQACYPTDIDVMREAIAASDLTVDAAAGTHFGGAIAPGAPTGASMAAAKIRRWLNDRY